MERDEKGRDTCRGRPKSEKHREVALELLSAAERTLSTKGYTEITSRELADLAGTNQAMIRYYYDCKDGLFSTVVENALRTKSRKFDEFERGIGDMGGCAMRAFVALLVEEYLVKAPLYRVLLAELANTDSLIKARYSGQARRAFIQKCRILDKFKAAGILGAHADTRLAAFTLVCFINGPIALSTTLEDFQTSIAEICSEAWIDHVTGIMLLSYGPAAKGQN